MPKLDLANAAPSQMEGRVEEVAPPHMLQDAPSGGNEFRYQNTDWSKQWGHFNSVPELKSAMLMKSIWNVGKGYTCDTRTKTRLENIRGWGKDTFTDILFNMDLISRLSGDSFSEIIRDEKGKLTNLKPLDPGSVVIVTDGFGIIKHYEFLNRTDKTKKVFQPQEIFHLSHNRLANQCHGISDLTSMERTIIAEFENFDDCTKIMHRQAKPMIMFKLGTDDETKIATFIAKMDQATSRGENIYIPDDENAVSYDVVQVNTSDMIMKWRSEIRNKFYRALGLPQIIFGSAGATEAGGKMEYLAHEQVFERDQRKLEEQIWAQLAIKIDLVSPVSLLPNIHTDQQKDAQQGMEMQPNDVTAGVGK